MMQEQKEAKSKLCMLCFIPCDENFELVDDAKRKMLETVTLEVDCSASKETVICKCCAKNLKKSFDFKSICLDIEECIKSFASEKSNEKLNLIEIYLNKYGDQAKVNLPEDRIVCRLCIELVNSGLPIPLGDDTKDALFLSLYLPEVDINVTANPVICSSCYMSLQDYFEFKKLSSHVYAKAKKPHTGEDADSDTQNKLELDILLKNYAKYENDCKLEIHEECHENDVMLEIASKTECVLGTEGETFDIKSEPVDNELKQISYDSTVPFHSENYREFPTDYKCAICAFKTKDEQSLENHSKTHNGVDIPLYQCEICPFQTKYRKSIVRHVPLHNRPTSGIEKYQCHNCQFETSYKGVLKKHTLTHKKLAEPTIYQCEVCQFQTKHKFILRRHMKVHKDDSEVTMYFCEHCSFKTKHKCSLIPHVLIHKPNQASPVYQCDVCPFKTIHKASIRKHKLLHEAPAGLSMYYCSFCKYKTKNKDYFNTHLLSHKNRSTATVTDPKTNTNKHTFVDKNGVEVTMYGCEICQFKTNRYYHLNKHMLVHQKGPEVLVYKCGTCEFKTKHKFTLNRHMLVHRDDSEVTMYHCEQCKFKTKHSGSLRMHILTHKAVLTS